jgi:nucleotidyltransferase/DNA polymerase involved in DNA repair
VITPDKANEFIEKLPIEKFYGVGKVTAGKMKELGINNGLIEKKKVFINGKLAILGSKVKEDDKVETKGDKNPKVYVYFAYNKPIP